MVGPPLLLVPATSQSQPTRAVSSTSVLMTTMPSQPMWAVCSRLKLTTIPSQPMRAVCSMSKFADQTKPIQRLVHRGLVDRLQSTILPRTAPDA